MTLLKINVKSETEPGMISTEPTFHWEGLFVAFGIVLFISGFFITPWIFGIIHIFKTIF